MAPNSKATVTPVPEEIAANPKHYTQEISYRTLWGAFGQPLKWTNIILLFLLHVIGVITLITFPYFECPKSFFLFYVHGYLSGIGITAGAHRLWTHKSYKAKLPLRIILIILYAMAGQNRLYDWVRDHRVHHKFSDTDADPHNSNRGFFFSHVGWLMMKKHPQVLEKGNLVCGDLWEDPVVGFYQKYFWPMQIFLAFLLPGMVPYLVWDLPLYWCFMGTIARYVVVLNITWSVNSAAHIFGYKPYNRNINPVENKFVSFISSGEGWHNYHHTFPSDYKAAELGKYSGNFTKLFIDIFAKIGWAYDLKSPSKELIQKTVLVNGDESQKLAKMF